MFAKSIIAAASRAAKYGTCSRMVLRNAPFVRTEVRMISSSTPLYKKKGGGGGGKTKSKEKKGRGAGRGDDEDEDEDDDDVVVELPKPEDYGAKMDKRLERLEKEFAKFRGGKVSPDMFNDLVVKSQGELLNIQEVAQISMPMPMKFTFMVYDPAFVADVGTAIRESDMGVNPTKGEKDNIWAVKANKPSTEARLEQVKQVAAASEKAKQDIRGSRKDGMDKIAKAKKNKDAGEDEIKRLVKALEGITEQKVASVGKMFKEKETDMMS